jgi:hypothetical protein
VRRFQSLNLLILTLVPSAQICNKELNFIENAANKKQKLFYAMDSQRSFVKQ